MYKHTTLLKLEMRLQRIANILLLNASFIDNLGLLNGKMGIALFFYHYARYNGNEIYENYAGELLDEIYGEISQSTPIDFDNGLSGIGWGIEYLVKNGFVDADTDEVLAEIDNSIYSAFIWNPLSINNQHSLFGYGFYCLARLNDPHLIDDNNLKTLKKKQLIIYLMDECERLLTRDTLFDEIVVPKFNLVQINSLLWFIIQTYKYELYPVKSQKLLIQLIDYINNKMDHNFDIINSDIFFNLMNDLVNYLKENVLITKCNNLKQDINKKAKRNIENEDIVNNYIKIGWNSILYNIQIQLPLELNEQAINIVNNDEFWSERINKLHGENLSLNNGIAGLGLILLNDLVNLNKGIKVACKSETLL